MNILAVDTSTEFLSLSLVCEEKSLMLSSDVGYRHGETLISHMDYLFKQMGLRPSSLNLVVCAIGPGSFTGLRIGLATVKGICTACACPLSAVSGLDAMAHRFRNYTGVVMPIIDAKKNCFYTAVYKQGHKQSDYLDISPHALLELINQKKHVLLTGPHAQLALAKIQDTKARIKAHIDTVILHSDPESLLQLGKIMFQERGATPLTVSPLYIRKSEAELAKQKKT
ncbi:MAG: tRNA (adenosine(37)-N6)-threonylcarbamoyltransferase complex dimerization subunit type 1 TsaB [Spirochaetales bacterium]|nr:tRNA (adenosine(37)-N6)-threonylcarbamoyltransferase complex dimerization subunit type 1 TsaB [Spirochaetales bacterium]